MAEMARVFGSDCTPNGLRFQFNDRIKQVTTRQLDMLAQGDDPKDIDLDDCKSAKASKAGKDIASLMGSDTSVSALKSEICERVKAIGKHQSHMKAAGQDPAKIDISAFNDRKGRQDISTYFGSDSTGGGIGFQFRAIKADAKRQRDCIDAGGDPRDLNIGGGKELARLLNDGSTKSALEHRFRPIKREAADMLAVIAREYGDSVTGKAVSGYFERVKKDPHWDRTKSVADISIEGTPKTPKTPKTATPRKRGPKAKKGAAQDDGDDSELQEFDTPSKKKATINKVKGGRVTKTGRAKPLSYAGQDMDEDDEEEVEDEGRTVKMEDAPVSSNGDGFEDGNGYEDHGHQNGYAVIGADEHDEHENFYNAAEDYGEA
ncbi:hypothetical protein LSUB1_G002346 [Lachnellula subtilissima]|uniref:Uncharacterized protein n=1 Tax=Lachnellula subtilissima TaxID=602034 RepID=A0A8H8UAW2_9HELO|nr:hypothetical protein LSUB1_G002346 [Lachnellula subtilissima]